AIAAAKLGFAPVHAVDSDPIAVEATASNAAANAVGIQVALADALDVRLPEAETALANVTLQSVTGFARRLRVERLVAFGYLASDRPELEGFRPVGRRDEEGWAADLFVRI